MSPVVKNVSFELNFWHESKFLDFAKCHPSQVRRTKFSTQVKIFLDFVKFYPLLVRSGQNSHFWAKFSTRLKISGFCQISSFACPEWLNSWFWAWFWLQLKISEFYHISSFTCPEWSKMFVFSQIFNTTQNFLILQNFVLFFFFFFFFFYVRAYLGINSMKLKQMA